MIIELEGVDSNYAGNTLDYNKDGSVDIYFGPKAPNGHEKNWIQTVLKKSWFLVIRFYGPLKPFYDKTWKPGEIELVK